MCPTFFSFDFRIPLIGPVNVTSSNRTNNGLSFVFPQFTENIPSFVVHCHQVRLDGVCTYTISDTYLALLLQERFLHVLVNPRCLEEGMS